MRRVWSHLRRGADHAGSGVAGEPEGFSAGVVISASHNPYHDNGVKLISASGMKFPDAIEAEIEATILGAEGSTARAAGCKQKLDGANDERLHQDYLGGLRGALLPGGKLAGMKIVLDCANGAASELAPELFRSLGANVTAIYCTRRMGAISISIAARFTRKRCRRQWSQSGAALGVAFDGDADRAIFATPSGRLVNGDGVLLAIGRYLKSAGALKGPAIVGTTMANLGLERALEKSGLKLTRTDVGTVTCWRKCSGREPISAANSPATSCFLTTRRPETGCSPR